MGTQPFRTGKTWLADDQLVLLDVLFDARVLCRLLRRESFLERWNLGYTHNFDDSGLERNLRWLRERGVLDIVRDGSRTWVQITPHGGSLWSLERCPDWDRYCIDRYTTTLRGRIRMSVVAVSSRVRDDFLALWPQYPARRRTALIRDLPLIEWHPFDRLYVGVATYEEPREWTMVEVEQERQHWAMLERERSWWRCVPELQRFIPGAAGPSHAPDS